MNFKVLNLEQMHTYVFPKSEEKSFFWTAGNPNEWVWVTGQTPLMASAHVRGWGTGDGKKFCCSRKAWSVFLALLLPMYHPLGPEEKNLNSGRILSICSPKRKNKKSQVGLVFTSLKIVRGKQKLWQANTGRQVYQKHLLKYHNTNAYIVYVYIPWLNLASWATDTCQYGESMQNLFSLFI